MKFISIIIFTVIFLLSSASPVLADGGEARHEVKEVDGYQVTLTFMDGDVQLGHNELSIEIMDPQAQLVADATVTVIAELYPETASNSAMGMDAQSSEKTSAPPDTSTEAPMETVELEMKSGQKQGEYEGELALEEPGKWMIKVVFLIQSQEKVAEFEVDLQPKTNHLGILWGFLGITVGIISVAAITRRKSAHTPALEETI